MELRHLRYFVAVAEEGSLTVAAEKRLHTAQPSLSRQLRDLELEVGTAAIRPYLARGLAHGGRPGFPRPRPSRHWPGSRSSRGCAARSPPGEGELLGRLPDGPGSAMAVACDASPSRATQGYRLQGHQRFFACDCRGCAARRDRSRFLAARGATRHNLQGDRARTHRGHLAARPSARRALGDRAR